MSWYANQHNIINIDLPLQYIKYEVGDIVEFDGLINNLKFIRVLLLNRLQML